MGRCLNCIHFDVCTSDKRDAERCYEQCLDFLNENDVALKSEAVQEILEEVAEKLVPTVSALFCIGETLVDVSKSHIDERQAINKIRQYLDKAICSRYQLEKVLEEIQKKYKED